MRTFFEQAFMDKTNVELRDRIALFLPSLAGGGAEKRMLNLATEFAMKGYPVDMVLSKAEGAYLNSVPAHVRVVDLGSSRPLRALPALVRYLSAEKPRALLSTIMNANLAAVLASQLADVNTRCVICEASNISTELHHSSAHNRFLMPLLIRRFFPKAHAIVAVSHGAADDLARMACIPRQSIRVIYNPVVSANLLAKSRGLTSHRWLKDSHIPVIVGMGRLTRQKNFAALIQAFALLRERIPSRLIILGDGEERPSLESLCMSLGIAENVDLPGFIANPYPILSKSSLFVLSSRWEGLPWVLIEALACGTKVVSTDCPSGPSEVLDNGAYGQLCPVDDVPALAAAMVRAMAGEFIAADPTNWLNLFSMEANSARYLDLILGRERQDHSVDTRCPSARD
jgi:glycosyltransferase involved in cell wall biosynthesis